jgi:glycerol kinase
MPNQRFVIALDQGTSSSRAILFDSKLEILGIEQVEVSQSYPNDGWVEQDPLELWNGLIDVAQRLIKNHGLTGKDIASIGIANQRETALVWEKSSGRPVYPAIVWQSRQTTEICQALRASNLESSIRSKTGLTIDSYFSAPKWRFILDHVPNGQSRTENGELLLGTVDSWIIWCLTNGASYMTDETNASRTMIWNIHTGEWDEELMSALNLPEIALPEVKTSGNDFGVTQKDIFGEEIPIRAVAGDQQASLFGHGCNSIGQAKNTYGTGCFILAFAGDTMPDNIDGILTSVNRRIYFYGRCSDSVAARRIKPH